MKTRRLKMSLNGAKEMLQHNIGEFGMYIALFVIIILFTILTKGVFLSSRNISNLLNQGGYIAVLAVGMTLVIIIKHIDLSVGYLSGFLGAVAAIAMVNWHLPVYIAILLVLLFGAIAGLVPGFLVAKMGIPAFVATLAGWLGYRGALQLATMAKGTIIIPNAAFNAISNGYLPDIPGISILPGLHKLTLILGVLVILLFIINSIIDRRKTQAYEFKVLSMELFILKLVFVSVLLGGITWV
ncbi:MAG: hypothetical protein MUO92_02815, partial [Dehalococcoidales bacterium]|nr:hypothetical protein [Dehalococcoidales bacterium]